MNKDDIEFFKMLRGHLPEDSPLRIVLEMDPNRILERAKERCATRNTPQGIDETGDILFKTQDALRVIIDLKKEDMQKIDSLKGDPQFGGADLEQLRSIVVGVYSDLLLRIINSAAPTKKP